MTHQDITHLPATPADTQHSGTPATRRADAGTVRLGDRDIVGLLLCGDMYGAPYDLLAAFLAVRPDRARGDRRAVASCRVRGIRPVRPRAGVVLADPHRASLPCQVNVLKF